MHVVPEPTNSFTVRKLETGARLALAGVLVNCVLAAGEDPLRRDRP
jgi:hypothetical protein